MRFPGTRSQTTDAILQQGSLLDEREANKARAKQARQQALLQVGQIGAGLAGDVMQMLPQLQAIRSREQQAEQDRAFERMMAGEDFTREQTLGADRNRYALGLEAARAAGDLGVEQARGRSAMEQLAEKNRYETERYNMNPPVSNQRIYEDELRLNEGQLDVARENAAANTMTAMNPDRYSTPFQKEAAKLTGPVLESLIQGARPGDVPGLMKSFEGGDQAAMDAEFQRQAMEKALTAAATSAGMTENLNLYGQAEPGVISSMGRENFLEMIAAAQMQAKSPGEGNALVRRLMEASGGKIPQDPAGSGFFGGLGGNTSMLGGLRGLGAGALRGMGIIAPDDSEQTYGDLEAFALEIARRNQGYGPYTDLTPEQRARAARRFQQTE